MDSRRAFLSLSGQDDQGLTLQEIHYFQYLCNVKKSVAERTPIKDLDRRTTQQQDDSSRSGNDTDANGADIKHIYDEEPMAEVQLTANAISLL
ncbi:hypothetical protein Tco_0549126 [Tanacetum coccineum]